MYTINELRRYQYDYHNEKFPFLNDWKKNPYSFLKSRFYMELSALMVYFLLKTRIKPNSITIVYGLAGILGGILLAIPLTVTHMIAIIIFFTKGILDWSDGHLARITGQASITGHVLDIYGASLNDVALQIGLGFYVAARTGLHVFYYLIPLIPFFYAVKLTNFSSAVLFDELSKSNFLKVVMKKKMHVDFTAKTVEDTKLEILGNKKKYYECFASLLDARARSVDFICLLILIEVFASFSVTWIIFITFVFKGFVSFIGGYWLVIKRTWIEKSLDVTIDNIKCYFEGKK